MPLVATVRSVALPVLLTLFAAAAVAADAPRTMRVEEAWARATPPGASVGAGYFELVNDGGEADRLVAAESPRAGRVMIHRTVEDDGSTRMEHQQDGVLVPPGARVSFSPGGYHLMLMQLQAPLEKGDTVPLTLRFERAGRVAVELEVRGLTAGSGD